jgi:putative IMPACT (imprinted ancient) family translation regulator
VVRYFGGTLLGTSGLINAYRSAAADAIAGNVIETRDLETRFRIECPYSLLNEVMQIIKAEGYLQEEISMTDQCTILISVKKSAAPRAESLLMSIFGITIKKQDVDK